MESETTVTNHPFLTGGGEMGTRIMQRDWSNTPVGKPESWPQSLRTTLGIILHSKFPMFLYWGKELICFYNDAYRPSLGENGKHPQILGQRAEEAWPEIWHILQPLIEQVLSGGEATWSEDQLLPIYRNGRIEDVYWTFSHSPVFDELGQPAGVMVTCYETTEKITVLKDIKDREDQLNFTLEAAELGTWDLSPETNRFVGNELLKSWFGLAHDEEVALNDALQVIIDKDKQRVIEAIAEALRPGSPGMYDIEYTIQNPVSREQKFVIAKGKALFDSNNIACRFSGTLQDITQQVIARKKLEKSETEFRNTVKQVAVGIAIFQGPDFIVEIANDSFLQIVGRHEKDFIGRPLFDSLPEAKEIFAPLLTNVLETGVPYFGTEFPVTLSRYGNSELTYFNFACQPFKEASGEITGIIVVATEVTQSVRSKHLLAESEKQFRNFVMQSPIPMALFAGKDFVIEMANTVMFEKIWRRQEHEIIGRKALEAFPELVAQKYPELLSRVFNTGIAHVENESVVFIQGHDGLKKFFLDYKYAPLYDTDNSVSAIMITVNDVTEKVEARQKVEEAEQRLRLALDATDLATWELDLKTRNIIFSSRLAEIFGGDTLTSITHQEMRNLFHADDLTEIVEKAFDSALQTGIYFYEARILKGGETTRWIRTQGKVNYDENNQPVKIIGTTEDITVEKNYRNELEEREQKFRLLANSMPQFIWTGDAAGRLNYFNQSVFEYSGLHPDKFNNDGWLQIVHPDDREENIERWMAAVSTGNNFLFEHRFLRFDGEYRWQLSRAIPQKDAAGVIQMWVGTSTDIQDQKTFAMELEKQVRERTNELQLKNIELERMNAELKSFAYVSSHDLQEPLRKIQTFASRIIEKDLENLSERGKDYFTRMQEAAKRMQTLIEDLLAYSRTSTSERVFRYTDLNDILTEVSGDFKELLVEKNAKILVGEMCEANIIPFQFRQLMQNLLSNSLKFSKPGEDVSIRVSSKIVRDNTSAHDVVFPKNNYCHIIVSDNGIGFDPQYRDRIFEVFQRLHGKEEYSGTGIGLSIVKKIVENHNGYITATGDLDKGAIFDIYIPAD